MQGFTYKYGDRPLEGYTIQRAAGRGGFGEVYYALSDSGREVALKVVQGFEDIELRGISQCMNLKSPHLVAIFDVRHNDQGKPFVIMEFVAGPSLRELIDESPAGLGTQKAAFFLREIAKGLTYLHDRGIVHRDLKPGNVFYEDGYVKIGDYGLSKAISASKHSGQTITVGTVHYMAPEIGQGRYDRSIDIYALGCMLNELLTGQTPFLGGSTGEILMKHLVEEPKLEGIEEPFAGVIRKAMAKDPKDRFQTVQEMVEAVFGAAHIQQSVSCFSPDNLTMVAGRVAKKVTAGGAGSSGKVDMGAAQTGDATSGTGSGPGPAGAADRLTRKFERFGERMGQMGQRIGEKLEAAGARLDERLGGAGRKVEPGKDGQPAAAPWESAPALPPGALAVDPKRDPLNNLARGTLCVVTVFLMAAGTGVFSSQGWGGQFLLASFACYMTIMGAGAALSFAYFQLGSRLRSESPLVRRLAFGGLACVLAGLCNLLGPLLCASGQANLIMTEHYIRGTALAIAIALFLMNWPKLMDPARRERIDLGYALKAGLLGFVLCQIFQGNTPFVLGALAGLALAVQACSPFDPLAIRGRKQARKIKSKGELDLDENAPERCPRREQRVQLRQDRQQQRRQDRAERFSRVVTALDLHAQPHPLEAQARVALMIVSIVLLGLGLAGVLAVMTGSASIPGDRIALVFFGTTGMLASFCTLGVACRGRMVNPWATFIRPVLLMACVAGILTASLALGGVGGRLSSDGVTAAIFFMIFPPILMLILGVLPRSLAPTTAGQGGPGAGTPQNDNTWSGGYPFLPPSVSPYKRMVALILATGWFMGLSGLQRFYVGKIWTGLLWLFTGGGFAIGQIVDAIHIATGQFTDKQGRRLLMWTDREELGYGWQTPSPLPQDGRGIPASPDAAPTDDSNTGRPAPSPVAPVPASWHPDPWASQALMHLNRTDPLLAALGGLLMILSLVSGLIGTLSRPAMTVVAAFDKNLPTWFDSFMAGSWQETLDSLQMALSVGLMFLAVLVLIVARRWAGGAHMFRAIIGSTGMLVSLHVSRAALNIDRIDWADKVSLVQHGYFQDVLREVVNNAYTGGFVLAGLVMLGSVLILAWPPRRQEQVSAVGKGV